MKCVEIRKGWDFGRVFIILYILAFLTYLVIGFLPAGAVGKNSGFIEIPKIDLFSEVVAVELENGELPTPERLVGSYSDRPNKTFLFGHSSTIFEHLHEINLDDIVVYNNQTYFVYQKSLLPKDDVKMREVLSETTKDTIVIMTCAGTLYGDGGASHRLVIYAAV